MSSDGFLHAVPFPGFFAVVACHAGTGMLQVQLGSGDASIGRGNNTYVWRGRSSTSRCWALQVSSLVWTT